MNVFSAIVLVVAGLLGASGVATAAASSHAGTAVLGSYALIALTHASALLALALRAQTRILSLATAILALGALLFCGDLAMRHFTGTALFPYAAPAGGFMLIAGWSVVLFAGIVSLRR